MLGSLYEGSYYLGYYIRAPYSRKPPNIDSAERLARGCTNQVLALNWGAKGHMRVDGRRTKPRGSERTAVLGVWRLWALKPDVNPKWQS